MNNRKGVILLSYDICMENKENRRNYRRFRKHILEAGYQMIQCSLYIKLIHNLMSAESEEDYLKRIAPEDAKILILKLPLSVINNAYISNPATDINVFSEDIVYV